MGSLLLWMQTPPEPEMPLQVWQAFLDTMATYLLISIVVGVAVMSLCYGLHTRLRHIRSPHDVFAPFTPLAWLAVALLPAAMMVYGYASEFRLSFPIARTSEYGGGTLAVIAAFVTLVAGYLLMWTPLTPRKFRYRPRALVMGLLWRKHATTSS
jgi:hypothetical protein